MNLCQKRTPSPTSKIIKNLCQFACCDPRCTPGVMRSEGLDNVPLRKGKGGKSGGGAMSQAGRDGGSPLSDKVLDKNGWKWNNGIISLIRLENVSYGT